MNTQQVTEIVKAIAAGRPWSISNRIDCLDGKDAFKDYFIWIDGIGIVCGLSIEQAISKIAAKIENPDPKLPTDSDYIEDLKPVCHLMNEEGKCQG